MPDNSKVVRDEEDEEDDSSDATPSETTPSDESPSSSPGADEQFCSSCGEVIKKDAEICPSCGVRQQGTTATGEKNAALAALLSFLITGAGQIYNGQVGKGVALLAIQFVNILLMFVVIGFFTAFLTWVYAIYDAYTTAEKINQGEIQV